MAAALDRRAHPSATMRAVDRAKASKRGKLAQFADDSSLEEMDSNLNRSAPFLIKQCRSHDGLKGLATRNRTITSKDQINQFPGPNNPSRKFSPPTLTCKHTST